MHRLTRPASLALVAAALSLALSSAEATPAYSWNLSRSLLTPPGTNPDGAWTYMESTNASATVLSAYTPRASSSTVTFPIEYWPGSLSGFIAVPLANSTGTTTVKPQEHGVAVLHPGSGTHIAVKWTNDSGIALGVRLLGRVTDADRTAGDGVNFYVVRENGSLLLTSGTVAGSTDFDGKVFFANTGVLPGQSIYFIIDRRTGYGYDTTELDIFIAGAYDCSVVVPSAC